MQDLIKELKDINKGNQHAEEIIESIELALLDCEKVEK